MKEIHIRRPMLISWCATCEHVTKAIEEGEKRITCKDFIRARIDIKCKGHNIQEGQMEISSEIEFKGKGYGRVLPRSKVVNCPSLEFEREN